MITFNWRRHNTYPSITNATQGGSANQIVVNR